MNSVGQKQREHNCVLSNSQVDRLGACLKKAPPTAEQLTQLDTFRQSFTASYKDVYYRLTHILGMSVTGRPAKSTTSIIEKLRREKVRLSQMQDIAGCRVIAEDTIHQNTFVKNVCLILGTNSIDDRRSIPSHGYRAIHVISSLYGRSVEVQIRSRLQHMWAELSEKLSDVYGSTIKYGVGNADILEVLSSLSTRVATVEGHEQITAELLQMRADGRLKYLRKTGGISKENIHAVKNAKKVLATEQESVHKILQELRDIVLRHGSGP